MSALKIKQPIVRLFMLLALGIPAFTNWPICLLTSSDPFLQLGGQLGYLLFIYLVIVTSFGLQKLTEWILAAAMLSTTVVIPQILFTQTFHELASFGIMTAGPQDKTQSVFLLVKQFVTMMTVIPYGAMLINSFSVSGVLRRAYSFSGKNRIILRHSCLVLRVAQHIFESFPPLVEIWKEEYPRMLVPRFRSDMGGAIKHIRSAITWLTAGAKTWSLAALVFAFEPMAMFCHEIESLHRDAQTTQTMEIP